MKFKELKNKSYIKWILSLILGISIFVLLIFFLDWPKLVLVLKRTNPFLVFTVFLLNLLVVAIKGWRWQIIISSTQRIPILQAILITIIGFFGNSLLPARAGDLGKALILAKYKEMSRAESLGTVTLDKAMDVFSLILLIAPLPLFLPVPKILQEGMVLTLVFSVALFLFLFIYAKRISSFEAKESYGKIKRGFIKLSAGFQAITNISLFLKAFFLAFIAWLLQVLMLFLTAKSLGFNLTLAQSTLVLLGLNIVISVPATPGNIGTLHVSVIAIMGLMGFNAEQGMSEALIFHTVQIVPLLILGPILSKKIGLNLFSKKNTKEAVING